MKRLFLILSASSLLLVGAGCANGQSSESQVQTPPAVQPARPAAPPAAPVQKAMPPQPATPPALPVGAGVSLKADVAITAGGTFSPAVVTVKKGSTVTWTNDGDAQVWIASNPHPTHTDYPGFDSKAAIDPGNTYSFTFNNVGSWGYHNHLNPTVQGTVIVTE